MIKRWWLEVTVGASLLLIAVCFAIAIPTAVSTRTQAKEGNRAREIQMLRQPISNKLYSDAHRRHVLTAQDLRCVRHTNRANCLPPPSR